jgi:hypothetical protein
LPIPPIPHIPTIRTSCVSISNKDSIFLTCSSIPTRFVGWTGKILHNLFRISSTITSINLDSDLQI